MEKENHLTPHEKRDKVIEQIELNNDISEALSRSQQGDPAGIQARFFCVPPEKGGFSDLAQNEELLQEVFVRVDERLEEGDVANDWSLYEAVGKEVRDEYADSYDEIYREPPISQSEIEMQDRREAIEEMREARHQR